ncbi:ATP-dependent Clp protease ATP-binding subunit [Candidatus Saccharibacteria bacterium]|nr:ATP-dependent Clp protease ATP-binding subunit [Candidatus Saccharibacteria bacterium]
MNLVYHYNSTRARSARLGRLLGKKPILYLCLLLAIALFAFWIILLIQKMPLGWLCFSGSIFCFMIYYWTIKELIPVPVHDSNDINSLLSNNVLANLPKNPKPKDLANMVQYTNSGRFFAIRYGISSKMLAELVSNLPDDISPIFQNAIKIYQGTQSEEIHGAIIAAAIITSHPMGENILRQMKLEVSDLLDGIIWFNYLNGLVKGLSRRPHSGGIARDLNFGYIPTLQRFGQNISVYGKGHIKTQLHLASHREIVSQMIQIFSNQGRQNVALIGPSGSGRSTIVHAFADQLLDADAKLPSNIRFRQIFKLDAASLISAAPEPGQIEALLMHIFNEAYTAKNIIIWLENAQLFFEDGTGSLDIANLIMPILEAGKLRIILTMDKQKYLKISAKNSTLTNSLNKIMVNPANAKETMKVMQDQVPNLEYQHKVSYTIWALKEAYRLSERYVHDLEMPGRAVSLLDAAGDYALPNGLVTDKSVQQAVEKTEGVKVQQATDQASRAQLLNMEELIHKRMVDQKDAVKTVSDALRRSAAGVRNEKRPIGTYLFLGPTGVGKTELAKAISEVYFNGENNIVRLDLNEFVNANDVSRLIADGAEDEMSLTAQVMKQPFSVVLLDEIEKAHPQVLTTLLQMLDEGILRDIKGREVSFRDTIVIATSNAGAEKIREQVNLGNPLVNYKEQLVNDLMKSGEFKPEFLNRFDEICLFKPLSPADCLQVLDLIIASVNKTLSTQKISITLDDDAKNLLVEKGYDPQLGARPMKRIVQKSVENLVAKFVLSGNTTPGMSIQITRSMLEEELNTK